MSQFIRDLIALLVECCLSRKQAIPIDDHDKTFNRVAFADVESSRIKGMRQKAITGMAFLRPYGEHNGDCFDANHR